MMQSKSTMMQSKSQPKQSKGRKQMTSRPQRQIKPCQACAYMAWNFGIETPSQHHITKCERFTSKKLESTDGLDWKYEPNQATKSKYPNIPDNFTGSQIFDIPGFKDYYKSLPDLSEDTSASSNTDKSERI